MKQRLMKILYDFEDEKQKELVTEVLPDFEKIISKIKKSISDIYKTEKDLSLYFVKENTIRLLNLKYRNIDKSTDVLSFPSLDEKNFLGEIVISFENIVKRSEMEDENIENTLVYMIFHSYLHLLGYEHDTDKDYEIIEEKTEELLGRYNNL
ncbi:MAG: rRNA maturation RNase YbeY [Spirochaetales bacterium]|nr:rRNA maturation RNase YbeY [Exilispira sp.]NMC67586.1 rRNA maturation RNase YbeY [Spirochaetales bacterium]